jgi:hypothetical protein
MTFKSSVPALPALAAVLLCGCEFSHTPTGPAEHESKSVDLEKLEMARVNLQMGAGNLKIKGGSPKLVEADFTYNVPSWKPEFRYTNTGVRGDLEIRQPSTGGLHTGKSEYTWDLRLNDDVPLDLTIHFGAGEADLNLGSTSLRSVNVEMGVGELKLDLRGNPKRSYDVRVNGGVGEATVYLPKEVGIEADAQGGIGGINVTGLHKQDGRYVNDAYESAKTKIHLNIRGGVGNINLRAD